MTMPFGVVGVQTATAITAKQDADAQRRQTLLLVVAAVVAFLFIGRAGRGRRSW